MADLLSLPTSDTAGLIFLEGGLVRGATPPRGADLALQKRERGDRTHVILLGLALAIGIGLGLIPMTGLAVAGPIQVAGDLVLDPVIPTVLDQFA